MKKRSLQSSFLGRLECLDLEKINPEQAKKRKKKKNKQTKKKQHIIFLLACNAYHVIVYQQTREIIRK